MPQTIGLALFLAGVPLPIVNFFTIGFGATLINAAITLGASLAINALLRPRSRSRKPSDVQQQIRQVIVPRRRAYGTVKVAGAVIFIQVHRRPTGEDGGRDWLHLGLYFMEGLIQSYDQILIDNNPVSLNASNEVISQPYKTEGTQVPVTIETRLGAIPETVYPNMQARFGIPNFRGDGCATLLGRFDDLADADDQLEQYPQGVPTIHVIVRATRVWDWRDPAQIRTNPATWQWSDNNAVCTMHFMLDRDGYATEWELIEPNLAEWTEAANVCDELIAKKGGGLRKRYRLAAVFELTDEPKETLARLLETFDGRCWQKADGTIGIRAGKFYAPSERIRSQDIAGYDLSRGQDPLQRIEGVRAQYNSAAHDYQEQDADPWPDGPTVAALGEDRVHNLDLTWVPDHDQCRALMKRFFLRVKAQWRGKLAANLAGLVALDEPFVHIELQDGLIIDQSFETSSFTLDPNRPITSMEFLSVNESIDAWDAEAEAGTPPEVAVVPRAVTRAEITPFGNMTTNGGIEAAFNADIEDTVAESARFQNTGGTTVQGFVGATFAEARPVTKVVLYAPLDGNFGVGFTPTFTIRGQVSGAAPSSSVEAGSNGVSLGTLLAAQNQYEVLELTIDPATPYLHIWATTGVPGGGTATIRVNELQIFPLPNP